MGVGREGQGKVGVEQAARHPLLAKQKKGKIFWQKL